HERITASRIHRNGVGEMTVALESVEVWIRRATDQPRLIADCTAGKIVVRMPQVSVMIRDRGRLHDQPHRLLTVRYSWQNLDSIQFGRRPLRGKFQMEITIFVR